MEDRLWSRHRDPGVPHHVDLPDAPSHRLFENRALEMPQGVAATIMGIPVTYDELNRKANQFAHALKAWGLNKGDRVAIIMGNSPSFLSCQQGILKAGGVVVTVNPLYTGRELLHVLSDCGAGLVLVLSLFADKTAEVMDRTSIEKMVAVPIPGMDLPLPEGAVLLDDFVSGSSEENPGLEIGIDDPALIIYTGGTTGRSKGAVLAQRSLVYTSVMLSSLDPDMKAQHDSFLLVMPLFHIMGNLIATWCLTAGVTMHLVPQFDPGVVLQTIHELKPTWLPGVPTMFIALMNHPEVDNYDLTSIRYCVSGAAPFAVEPMEQFEQITGCRVAEIFGLTESGAPIMFNPFVNQRKPGSIGFPTADMDARIVDQETGEQDMDVGEPGELILKGPPIMMQYWNMAEETRDTLRDGWLHTGDIAKMDEDGFFWIVDRKKDMIIAGGFNIYPREIDEVLFEHPKVELACAIGVPDPYRGETVKAFIVAKAGETLTEEEILSFCRERLTPYKVPKIIEFRDSLPTSIIGKVLRKELRAEEQAKRS